MMRPLIPAWYGTAFAGCIVRITVLILALVSCRSEARLPPSAPTSAQIQKFVGCSPCTVRVSPHLAAYHITMELVENAAEDSVVTALRVRPVDAQEATAQRLPVSEEAGGEGVGQEIYTEDLNRDGYMDLALSTGQGMVNFYYDYWRFDPQAARFVALGNYPVLERVGSTGEFATFERGSCCTYTQRRYRFDGDTLVMVYSDITGNTAVESDTIVRVVEVRRGNRTLPVCREAIVSRGSPSEERRDTIPAPTRCPAELGPHQPSH